MAATTTPSIRSLIKALDVTFTDITFEQSDTSAWNPQKRTVYYEPDISAAQLLHEVGHAVLGHAAYRRDVELVRMEREAWQKAEILSADYGVSIQPSEIETHLDSYREWLHARSTCPRCSANGIQSSRHHFRCIECRSTWRVNDARACGLRRYLD